jgi:hypothetical protein
MKIMEIHVVAWVVSNCNFVVKLYSWGNVGPCHEVGLNHAYFDGEGCQTNAKGALFKLL